MHRVIDPNFGICTAQEVNGTGPSRLANLGITSAPATTLTFSLDLDHNIHFPVRKELHHSLTHIVRGSCS